MEFVDTLTTSEASSEGICEIRIGLYTSQEPSAAHNRDRRLMIFFAVMNELSLPPERAVPPAVALSVTSPVVTLTDGH
ncbi:hypothetical protein J6590_075989 [Homalodisca vitripennis]|nr:hypothetical protein J6590_075989 [Homalodisca vitripennis]